jgi:hypothetical protein
MQLAISWKKEFCDDQKSVKPTSAADALPITLEHFLVRNISVLQLDRSKFHSVLIPFQ